MTSNLEPDVVSSTAAEPAPPASVGKTRGIRVLLIEDDEDYREALAGDLSDRGFSVQGFADAASFLQSLDAAVDADLVLLDWGLPQTSGIDLLAQMRQRGIRLPVVFLTGRTSTKYETLAFDSGAVDFIDKARGVDVLVKRLRRAVETAAGPAAVLPAEKSMMLGKLVLKPKVSRACWNHVDVGLTVGEYKIVELLASNAGRYVTYRAIYDRMHYAGFVAGSGDHGYRSNVRSGIKRIRIKFHQCDSDFDEIQNYTGVGYRWKTPA
jgi:two-component system response regulator ChvI